MRSSLPRARFQRLAKEGSWIVAGQVAAVLGALVLVRVLTEYLEPAQYGQLALGLTVAGLVNSVVMGGVVAGIGRFYSIAAEKNDLPGYLHASRRLMGYVTAAVAAIALLLVAGLLWFGYSQWLGMVVAALVFSVLSAYNSALSGIQNAARQRTVVALHGGLDAWLKILLAVGVMLWLGKSSTAVVMGYALSSLIVISSQFIFLRRLIRTHDTLAQKHENWERQMLHYSWPFIIWGVFGWAQQSSGRWALEIYSTTADVGLYTVLTQLGYSPIQMAVGLLMTFFTPILFAMAGDASCAVRNDGVRNIIVKMVFVGGGMTVGAGLLTTFLHPYIFNILVSEKYASASYLLPWLVLSAGLFAIAQVLASLLMTLNMTAKLSFASIGSSLIGILASILCVKNFGLEGMIAASLIHSASYLLLVTLTVRTTKNS